MKQNVRALQHFLHHLGISADGNALPAVVEIIVVVGETAGQAADDERGQLPAVAPPLLFGIPLDELGIYVRANQAERLLFQILRLGNAQLRHLTFDHLPGLFRRANPPHFREGVHVEGQIVQLVPVDRQRTVNVVVELRKLVDILPHFAVAGVEDVRPVFVDVDTGHFFGVDVAGNVVPAVDHQTAFAPPCQFSGKNRAVQPRPDDQIIIPFHFVSPISCFGRCSIFG